MQLGHVHEAFPAVDGDESIGHAVHRRACALVEIDGELLRELTIDLTRDYQPTGRPPGPNRK